MAMRPLKCRSGELLLWAISLTGFSYYIITDLFAHSSRDMIFISTFSSIPSSATLRALIKHTLVTVTDQSVPKLPAEWVGQKLQTTELDCLHNFSTCCRSVYWYLP